jgi:hypothetical protein
MATQVVLVKVDQLPALSPGVRPLKQTIAAPAIARSNGKAGEV